MIVTFLATLATPTHVAVLFGASLSLLFYVYSSVTGVRILGMVVEDDGNLYFAAAYTLEQKLPSARESRQSIVVLRLRAQDNVASTFVTVLERYAEQLQRNGGKLILSGVGEQTLALLDRTETTELIPKEDIFPAEDALGVSTRKAVVAAQQWLEGLLGSD